MYRRKKFNFLPLFFFFCRFLFLLFLLLLSFLFLFLGHAGSVRPRLRCHLIVGAVSKIADFTPSSSSRFLNGTHVRTIKLDCLLFSYATFDLQKSEPVLAICLKIKRPF